MIYLDNSATTIPEKCVVDELLNASVNFCGNPSSTHFLGTQAAKYLNESKSKVANAFGCKKEEIYFTPGGTYADNTAIFGTVEKLGKRGKRIVTSSLEHPAVEECMKRLESRGFEIVRLPCDENGHFSRADAENAIDKSTILVSVMAVNNEIGVINDIKMLRKIINKSGSPALLHTDAVQAFGKINIKTFDADLISVSSHKIHGPKGIGALYIKNGIKIHPYILGGGQEGGLVSGTEALANIGAFAKACELIGNIQQNLEYMTNLRDNFVNNLQKIPGVYINSPDDALPYIVNFSVPGIPSEVMVNYMSERQICISAGSACKKGHRSDVLSKIGLPPERIDSAVRVSMSRFNTNSELEIFIENLNSAIARFTK